MHLGGMLDDKKSQVYSIVEPQYLPTTIHVNADTDMAKAMNDSEIDFPVMIKPDVGFKGFMVKKIDNINELEELKQDFDGREMLLQEFLTMGREFSIMCYYLKEEGRYLISSFVEKHLPHVVGDGESSIKQLVDALDNPFLNKKWVKKKLRSVSAQVPAEGEKVLIDHVGNYARGSKFVNLNDQIDEALVSAMNDFFRQISGLNFGRLDLKADSIDAIRSGDFKIVEVNGAKAEPIHIYDPQMSWVAIIRSTHFHWRTLYRIVKENRGRYVNPSTIEGLKSFRSLKKTVAK